MFGGGRSLSSSTVPVEYAETMRRLHLYVHDIEKDYVYPDPHVKVLSVETPPAGNVLVHIGYEDTEDLAGAQWNDLVMQIEKFNGKWALEGRFTGAYSKTLWFDRPTKGRYDIATYFDKVWFTVEYDPETEEFKPGEYWV